MEDGSRPMQPRWPQLMQRFGNGGQPGFDMSGLNTWMQQRPQWGVQGDPQAFRGQMQGWLGQMPGGFTPGMWGRNRQPNPNTPQQNDMGGANALAPPSPYGPFGRRPGGSIWP